jgi:hypothetical protein
MQGDFVNTLIGLCEVFSFWVNFCTFLTWRIWFLHIQRNFVEKVALIHQIWKIKILNHQISATGSRLQYVANRYREGFWKFSMFWCILQICLNLLVDDCQFNCTSQTWKKKKKKKNPGCVRGESHLQAYYLLMIFLQGLPSHEGPWVNQHPHW